MATVEELEKQVTELTTKNATLIKDNETLTGEKAAWGGERTTFTTSAAEAKTTLEKAEADLLVAQKEPDVLKAEVSTLKDDKAKLENASKEQSEKLTAHEATESQLADSAKEVETLKGDNDKLRGRVRATLITSLVGKGFKEDVLKTKDLSALEAIDDAAEGRVSPLGEGLDGASKSASTTALTAREVADRELTALGMKPA